MSETTTTSNIVFFASLLCQIINYTSDAVLMSCGQTCHL